MKTEPLDHDIILPPRRPKTEKKDTTFDVHQDPEAPDTAALTTGDEGSALTGVSGDDTAAAISTVIFSDKEATVDGNADNTQEDESSAEKACDADKCPTDVEKATKEFDGNETSESNRREEGEDILGISADACEENLDFISREEDFIRGSDFSDEEEDENAIISDEAFSPGSVEDTSSEPSSSSEEDDDELDEEESAQLHHSVREPVSEAQKCIIHPFQDYIQ